MELGTLQLWGLCSKCWFDCTAQLFGSRHWLHCPCGSFGIVPEHSILLSLVFVFPLRHSIHICSYSCILLELRPFVQSKESRRVETKRTKHRHVAIKLLQGAKLPASHKATMTVQTFPVLALFSYSLLWAAPMLSHASNEAADAVDDLYYSSPEGDTLGEPPSSGTSLSSSASTSSAETSSAYEFTVSGILIVTVLALLVVHLAAYGVWRFGGCCLPPRRSEDDSGDDNDDDSKYPPAAAADTASRPPAAANNDSIAGYVRFLPFPCETQCGQEVRPLFLSLFSLPSHILSLDFLGFIHHERSWIALSMTVPAFAFSVAAAASCQFLVLGSDSKSRQDRFGLGLFRYESPVDSSCVQYSESFRDEYFDAAIEISRWVAVMACVLIGVALLLLVVAKLIVGFGDRADFGACTWNVFRCCIYLGLYCTL